METFFFSSPRSHDATDVYLVDDGYNVVWTDIRDVNRSPDAVIRRFRPHPVQPVSIEAWWMQLAGQHPRTILQTVQDAKSKRAGDPPSPGVVLRRIKPPNSRPPFQWFRPTPDLTNFEMQ